MYIKTTLSDYLSENVIAWHGTPFTFTEFSSERIGSGMGMQSFGWGIYFTTNKKDAKEYAKDLEMQADVLVDGKTPSDYISKFISSIATQMNTVNSDKIIMVLLANRDRLYKQSKIDKQEFDSISNIKNITVRRNRILYQVRLEGDFMPWESPLSLEHINKISLYMDNVGYNGRVSIEDGKVYKTIGDKSEITKGGYLYMALAGDIGFDSKKASLFLLAAGIDGVRYNGNEYVVFSTSSINILKKIHF